MSLLFRIILVSIVCWSSLGWSATTNWLTTSSNQHVNVLVSAKKSENDQIKVLINVELMAGWKTYWLSPGEGGTTPKITWLTPINNIEWNWPVPQRFIVSGLSIQGYQDKVVFPLTLTTQASRLQGVLELSTCNQSCILSEIPFDIDLTQQAANNFDYEFLRAMATVPVNTGIMKNAVAHYKNGELTIDAEQIQTWQNPDLFFVVPDGLNFSEPKIAFTGTKLKAIVKVTKQRHDDQFELNATPLMVVINDNNMAQTLKLTVQNVQSTQDNQYANIWLIAVFALLGGFILNLMPCVLPVLGMKLSSILRVEQRDKASIRKQFLLSASGIMASFIFLAGLMTILRLGQHAVGWGIQFQNGWFIGFMVAVTFIFSANLLDLFTLNLPSRFSTYLGTTGGHFWEGAFATLLATPCSAPFLGTAVAYALIAPYSHLWLIFILLAVGMSIPWLLIAMLPQIATWLPKPGRWMNMLRLVMGGCMLLTSFWLLSLLITHTGGLIFTIIVVTISLWLLFLIKRRYGFKVFITSLALVCLIVGGSIIFMQHSSTQVNLIDNIKWQPVSEQAITDALSQQKIVLIDITADWCITCKVNKFNVLMDPEIQQRLTQSDIIALRADWTVPSDDITSFLKRRGVAAVPFNQIYSENHPKGVILSTLLDKKTLLALINGTNTE